MRKKYKKIYKILIFHWSTFLQSLLHAEYIKFIYVVSMKMFVVVKKNFRYEFSPLIPFPIPMKNSWTRIYMNYFLQMLCIHFIFIIKFWICQCFLFLFLYESKLVLNIRKKHYQCKNTLFGSFKYCASLRLGSRHFLFFP